jgi:hypothetical protein
MEQIPYLRVYGIALFTRRIRRKVETHVKIIDTCKAQGKDMKGISEDLKNSLDI